MLGPPTDPLWHAIVDAASSHDKRVVDDWALGDVWRAWGEWGLQQLVVPAEYGGRAMPLSAVMTALEALGYASDNGLAFGLGAQMCACQLPLARFASADQKRRYLPALGAGHLVGAHAMSEAASGSDAFGLATSAVADRSGDWVLEGSKVMVTNGVQADVFVVFATTSPGRGFAGISAFLLDATTPGLVVRPRRWGLDLGMTGHADLILDGCHLPADSILGRPGSGAAIFSWTMVRERALLVAPLCGRLWRVVELCRERLPRSARASSAALAGHLFAAAALGQLRLNEAQTSLDRDSLSAVEAAGLKLTLTELFSQAVEAVRPLRGWLGLEEFDALLDASLAAHVYSGTSEILREHVAQGLRLGRMKSPPEG